MVCKECGSYNAENLSACKVCGAKLRDDDTGANSADDVNANEDGRPARDFVKPPAWPKSAFSGAPEKPVSTGSSESPLSSSTFRPTIPPRAAASAPTPTCPHCGKPVLSDAPFCAYCGQRLGGEAPAASAPVSARPAAKPAPVQPPRATYAANDYDDDDDEYDDDDDRESNARPSLFGRNRQTKNAPAGNSGSQSASRSSVSMPDSLSSGDPGSEVRVFHPTNLDEARRVTDTLLNRQSAILNLEGLDIAMAQRIIDFVGGSNYAIKGHFTRISNFVFLFTPSDVDIAGDLVQESAEASQEMGANGQNGLNFG